MIKIVSWLLRLFVAFILLQGLYFKLTSAPESVQLFEALGVEPWGRIGTAIAELIATVLLLVPRTKVYGALAAAVLMAGAIVGHLSRLGIEVGDDGGMLFGMAVAVLVASIALLFLFRAQRPMRAAGGPPRGGRR
jgi:uncharacterized membrane protein YphA (DoxX/SURF4 family)